MPMLTWQLCSRFLRRRRRRQRGWVRGDVGETGTVLGLAVAAR